MTIPEVLLLIFLFAVPVGLHIWCYQTVPVKSEHFGGDGFYSTTDIIRKRDSGRRWWLLIAMLFYFFLSLFVWNRTDPLSPTVNSFFWGIKILGIIMAIIAAGSAATFVEKEPYEWKENDEESSVFEAEDSRLLRQNRMQNVSRLQQASRRETRRGVTNYIKDRVRRSRQADEDY